MERRKSIALGADGFISKPFDPKELRAEVRRLLTAGA
jgi:DNA-binding response OmpR family regulator